jgi:hypothetical protein
VKHTRGTDNVVADALSRMFESGTEEIPDVMCANLLESLPLIYTSLDQHQKEDPFCKGVLEGIVKKEAGSEKYQIHKGLICYYPRGARRRRWLVPSILRRMVLQYFHDSSLSDHLGTFKTFRRNAANFWWPGMRSEVFQYVRKCEACQRAKPAQNAQVGKHTAQPASRPLERLFIDFVGPLPRTRRGNVAILVVVDAFSKYVVLFPVRRISSSVVIECLENTYFPAFGTLKVIVSDNAKVSRCRVFRDLCFRWGVEHVTTAPYYPQGISNLNHIYVTGNSTLK